jgi:hypothetical protein
MGRQSIWVTARGRFRSIGRPPSNRRLACAADTSKNGLIVVSELFELVALLALHWRVGLSVLFALIVAVTLNAAIAGFSGAYGVGLVLLGLGVDMLWHGDATRNQTRGAGTEER